MCFPIGLQVSVADDLNKSENAPSSPQDPSMFNEKLPSLIFQFREGIDFKLVVLEVTAHEGFESSKDGMEFKSTGTWVSSEYHVKLRILQCALNKNLCLLGASRNLLNHPS